ncbi:glycoside hydrolase family 38 C-terminal domain-containing protein [Paenibacillus sp.]|uniref:glycoside hydrolase family 38 N-terminal domain-containing protein n=1 Tax=Paenibacillus sp. TaxID=58172 RepID=UPI0028126A6F|nr:glycoside hydrolase family 38 C-terminal domain-containing protein [Paenibacillus sp.]
MEKKRTIYYFSHTHWDREWYEPFQGFRYRLVDMLNEAIETLEAEDDFRVFHLDGQTILLEDYIEIEPDKRERLAKLIRDGRLVVGPWYVMPDELLLSGESLIRNLMVGHRLAERWGGRPWKYGYVCDVFGHIAQMPQLFNGFGIRYAALGRGTNEHDCPAHFRWAAPDGSECITYKLQDRDGYGSFWVKLSGWPQVDVPNHPEELDRRIREAIDEEFGRSDIPIGVAMDGIDHEPIHPESVQYMQRIEELYPDAEVRHVNLEEMGRQLEPYRDRMPVKCGEIYEPGKNEGGYIHVIPHVLSSRYPLKRENDICQTLLEKWTEPLSVYLESHGRRVQPEYVEKAYRYLLQNHAHDSIGGCSIDQVHKDMTYRFDQAKLLGRLVVDEWKRFERERRGTAPNSSTRALLLWNPLPFPRKEVVTVDVDFPLDYPQRFQEPFGYELKNSFILVDRFGNELPYGIVRIDRNRLQRRHRQACDFVDLYTISFEADMPAMGGVEYKIVPRKGATRYLNALSKHERETENDFVRLAVRENGTIALTDKATGVVYDRLLDYLDDGEIGDGWYHVNPAEDRVVSSAGTPCAIEKVEDGPVRTTFRVCRRMRVPRAIDERKRGIRRADDEVELVIDTYVSLSKGARHVDVRTVVDNAAADHRLRLKLPTGIRSSSYFVNQPFAFVERKRGFDLATENWKERDALEKQMGGIVGVRAADGSGFAFVSAYGLHECAAPEDEEGALFVTLFRSFGRTVMTNGEAGGQLLGKLDFRYRLVPLRPEDDYADLIRLQESLQAGTEHVVYGVDESYTPAEPESLFVLDGKHLCMSVLKRPADGRTGDAIVRLYNMSDRPATGTLRSLRAIRRAEAVDLNEEPLHPAPHGEREAALELPAWKTMTLRFAF